MKNAVAILLIGASFFCVASLAQGQSGSGNVSKPDVHAFYSLSKVVGGFASEKLANPPAAAKAANDLLAMSDSFKDNWDYGNAIHHAHLVLGRLQLLDAHVVEAKEQLKLAGQTKGSPQLDSFGPNMTLAKELLGRGEKAAVLEYFDACLKFWDSKFAKPKIDEWKADIESGKTPSFGANLVY